MSTLLLAIVLTAAVLIDAVPEVEVQTLGGQTVVGPIVELDADRVTIETPDGRVSWEIDKLIGLFPRDKPAPSGGLVDQGKGAGAWIELVDGSSLVAQEYTVRGGRARITLSDEQVVELPTSGVTSVRLQAHSAEVAAEWSRIRKMKTDGDLLVVRKGEVVDYHQGILHDVTDQVVQFELDGEVLPIKRSKVHGLLYFHPPRSVLPGAIWALPEAICQIFDTSGSRWSVRSLAFVSVGTGPGDLQWTTPAGLTVTRPLAMITQIDFSRGKIIFLSDLKPESATFTPYFGPLFSSKRGKRLPLLGKFFAPREDTNLASGPLQLAGRQYSKGLALHSRTEVVYRLPGQFRRFQAVVGIDDGVRPHGNVRLVIHGDDRVLLEATVTGTDPPKPVDLDLTGVRRIVILADFGDKLDVADHLDLCEARIVK